LGSTWYAANKARINARLRERRATDPAYRERRRASEQAWRSANKARINARARERWAADPVHRAPRRRYCGRNYQLKRRYGITLADYDRMLKKQKGRCAICREKPRYRLLVDHDHPTGRVRRLLCISCNLGLGHFRDDRRLLRRADAYLAEESKPRRGPARRQRSPRRRRDVRRQRRLIAC
jgi:Recombination endonuclease VII